MQRHRNSQFFSSFAMTAPTGIYTLSLHDALPISEGVPLGERGPCLSKPAVHPSVMPVLQDRKSTRLNSSHGYISYAVFCLKKKKVAHTWTAVYCAPER